MGIMGIRETPKPFYEKMIVSGLPTTIPAEQKEEKSTNDGNTPTYTAPTYDNTAWEDTEKGKAAWSAYQDALSAVTGHGDFKYANKAQLDSIMRSILNREKFSYDFNGDAFYHQYKDKYIKQGKMAATDVMGQAAAMTGGYGNSYAATVGNQAYQASLEQLNDIIPELYQMAYDRYNQEGQDLFNKYGMLADDYARGYGEHQDKYDRLVDALGVARSDYYDGGDAYRAEQSNKNNILSQQFNDAMTIINSQPDETTSEPFHKAVFARTDDMGNNVFYINGKEYTFAPGVNPYIGTTNPDIKYGTFSNGYQPNNVNGQKLSKTGTTDVVNGVTQNVWKTPDGTLWIWDGTKNQYLRYEE